MTNETAVAMTDSQPKDLTVGQAMAEMGITARDLVIPKILLMQPTSEYVGDGKAQVGDVLNSQTLEILGGAGKAAVELIPLKLYKTWRVYDTTSKPPKFIRQENVTTHNESLPWEDNENGTPISRVLNLNFFALLVTDVAADEAFPVVISFRRTSMQAGKALATHLFKRAALGKLPYSQAVPLTIKKEKKEQNTYAVFEIGKGRACSDAELGEAKKWTGMLSSISYTVDDAEDGDLPGQAAQAPVVVQGEPADIEKF